MGRKFQKKKKVQQLEIVPLDENPPLPSQRPSDETIPRKVSAITESGMNSLLKFLSILIATGKMGK